MLLKFTNASEAFKGSPIYINTNQISAVFELAKTPGGSLTTVIYGGQTGITWEVEEGLNTVVNQINLYLNSKKCGCK